MIKTFKMKLYEGQEKEYERRHNELWPEMIDMIHEHGGKNYTICLDKETLTLFGYIEIEDEEAWRIHDAIKRLVANYSIPEICRYLKEQKQNGKLMLPSDSIAMYNELVRLGMPKGKGFSENHFRNSYTK